MFSFLQILLITLAITLIKYEDNMSQMLWKGMGDTVATGLITGIIMGDWKTGLMIGGELELMGLGLSGFGGASVPNYAVAASVGVAFAIATETGVETALLVGVPVATLSTSFDVLAKTLGSVWLHAAEKAAEEGNYKKMYNTILFGNIFGSRVAFNNTYPTLLCLILGSAFIDKLILVIPAWLISALKVTGNVLPALGIAMLIKNLNVKGHEQYLLLGFVLAAYLKLSILPIALLAVVIAIIVYQRLDRESKNGLTINGGLGDE